MKIQRVILIVTVVIIVVCLIQYLGNMKYDEGLYVNSKSIEESKSRNALIATFKIEQISDRVKDSLKKYSLLEELNQFEFWIEKHYNQDPKLLFFYPIGYSNANYFSFKNPFICMDSVRNDIFHSKRPEIAVLVEGVSPENYEVQQPDHSFAIDADSIIDAEIVFFWMQLIPYKIMHQRIGSIQLTRKDTTKKETFSDKSILSSFKLFPFLNNSIRCACCN